ncbi:alpha/beta hydrolase [Paenibacillus hemerocallicola]|uniref:Alpha/beta hydrolase n=1 Tax=Paenibacillus hemerocallicola TaxID=1172614 RepID=A0A5C4T4T4_9BACL|nr:alpha/beta hydrolase [Paenibacillus hemerocallicola]TNJ63179.1 alpha/beta hydrolase [Paenibacillus hemerocallicola]
MHVMEYKDVVYGPHERNVLDAYLVGNEESPSPAVLFLHGGGYVGGDKNAVLSTRLMKECIEAGISVVSANYRFITKYPFPAPMEDGTRAIQFVRHKAAEWGIDPTRIASAGSSAGGHIALWNALKGDLSKPDSRDPVERESSEVKAFVGFGTQASKDQRFYEGIYEGPHIQPNLKLFYGMDSIEDLYRPEFLKLAEEASAIHFMSDKAPPALMNYDYALDLDHPRIPAEAPVGEVIHHPMHGYVLKRKYDELGIPFVLRHVGDPLRSGEIAGFLLDSLG